MVMKLWEAITDEEVNAAKLLFFNKYVSDFLFCVYRVKRVSGRHNYKGVGVCFSQLLETK